MYMSFTELGAKESLYTKLLGELTMTNRKSQVEKFNARAAKMQADADAIKRAAMKREVELNNYEKEGERMLKEKSPTEEVFAVIARSGMESFMQVWNNSMESVIRETIRTEVRSMIQEELQSAMSGMFRGMNEAMTGVVKESFSDQVQASVLDRAREEAYMGLQVSPTLEEESKLKGPLSQQMKEQEQEVVKLKRVSRPKSGVNWDDAEEVKVYMFSLLDEAVGLGVDISNGNEFKKLKGKFNTGYQKGLPALFGKGQVGRSSGSWNSLIDMYYAR